MGMRIGSGGGAQAMSAAQSSVAQWQQAKVAMQAPAPAPVASATAPSTAPSAQLIATLTQGSHVNTYA